MKSGSLILTIVLFAHYQVYSQVVINEVCAANGFIIADDENDYEDWIEIYNPTSSPVSLNGYYLETFDDKQKRWYFPNVSVNPDSCILVFCSGKDRKDVLNHYEIPVIPGSFWRYMPGTSEPDPNWVYPWFDDSGWSTGPISIGYGDADDATTIAPVNSLYMRDTFSIPVTSDILMAYLAMDYDDAFVAYINGVEVARSNIWDPGKPPFDAYASEEREALMYSCPSSDPFDCAEYHYVDGFVLQSALLPGLNVLSMQIHNYEFGTDDMTAVCVPIVGFAVSDTIFNYFPVVNHLHTSFNLSSEGQRISLKNSSGDIMDEFILDDVHYNHSRGRFPDGSDTWCLFDTPTPCAPNSTCKSGYANMPSIPLESGFYSGSQTVSIDGNLSGDLIFYTTDGSTPTVLSNLYTGAFDVAQSTTIRAAIFPADPDMLPSDMITRTYIIDDQSTLPVVFITTDSLYLFDETYGIYMIGPNTDTTVEDFPYWGTANYYQDVEIPGHVEFLDEALRKRMGQDCTIKIHGNFSRGWPQKSFRFVANDKYGDGWFNFAPFPDKPGVDQFKSFNVRNGGVDFNTAHFRDGLMNRAARPLNIDIMDEQPCLVYINGDYWGVYGLREREDENYLATNYGIDDDHIDLLRFNGDVVSGSNLAYYEMAEFIILTDMSVESNYEQASSLLDIENFCDYMIAETYYNNFDWISEGGGVNNIRFWRNSAPASKWRYVMWDTDLGMNLIPAWGNGLTFDYLGYILGPGFTDPHSQMLKSLLNNETFHHYFINRFADIVNTTFSPATFGGLATEIHDQYEPEMERHFTKWGIPPKFIFSAFWLANSANIDEWNAQVDSLHYFINNRPYYARNNVEALFGLEKQVNVTLDVYPPGSGEIKISTVDVPEYPWTGVYYDGVPVTISETPNPGYTFSHWTALNSFATSDEWAVTLNIESDDQFTAHFEEITNDVFVFPNPFSSELTIEYHLLKDEQAAITIFDLSGRPVAKIIDFSTFQKAGVNYITVDPKKYDLSAGAYVLEFRTSDFVKTVNLIKVKTP